MDEHKLLSNLRPQLMTDEKVEAHVKGSYLVGIFTNTGPRKGILVATTHRMLFYGEGALNGQTFEAHAYAGMQTFELINQIGTEHFKWTSGGRRYDLRYASGNTQYLAQVVRPRVGQQPPSAPGMNQAPAAPTLDQQLANLADLRDRGALTPQQYDTAVARLLALPAGVLCEHVAVLTPFRQNSMAGSGTVGDWSQGVRVANARSLIDYWERGYDWRRFESELNRVPSVPDARMAGLDRRVPEADRPADRSGFVRRSRRRFIRRRRPVAPRVRVLPEAHGDRVDCIAHRKRVGGADEASRLPEMGRKAAIEVPSSPPSSGPCNPRGFSESI